MRGVKRTKHFPNLTNSTMGYMELTTICSEVSKSKFVLSPSEVDLADTELSGTTSEHTKIGSDKKISDQTKEFDFLKGKIHKLPRIKIIGTGGTIASRGANASQTAGYTVDLTIQELLDSIPDISGVCEIAYEQLCNVDSKEINEETLLSIYQCVASNIQKFDGLIITHGTDTLSETAFFIENTIDTGNVPIVFVGSMRPSSSLGFDGTMNLYQAICIASSKASRGRGILVSLNDQISAGYYITKTNANSLDSFNVRQGYLGNFVNNEIHYYYPPSKPLGASRFKLNIDFSEVIEKKVLPPVAILYAHQSFDVDLIELIVPHYKGLVIATMGAGSLPDKVNEYLSKLSLPVVYSKRSMDGMVPIANVPLKTTNCIAGGYLSPEKSRILLQLSLYSQYSYQEIRKCFKGVYGG